MSCVTVCVSWCQSSRGLTRELFISKMPLSEAERLAGQGVARVANRCEEAKESKKLGACLIFDCQFWALLLALAGGCYNLINICLLLYAS